MDTLLPAARRWKPWLFPLILALALLLVAVPAGATSHEVLVLEVEGPVTPAMASYFERGIAATAERDAAAMVVILNTPGGAIDTTQEIIRDFRNASVPIIVYVAPSGAQAASAGTLITLAAHAAGMAPETVIGAASPVDSSGADVSETLFRKITEDLKAQVRSMAERRGPEVVELAEAMIEEARAVNSTEALEVGLIDSLAPSLDALLEQLDGLEVVVAGEPQHLQTAGAMQVSLPMNGVEGVLHALSNPLLIGILLTLGVQGILIELSSPGGWVAGAVGVLCLALALYGLGQLPANWFGLGLVALAFALFAAEVVTPGVGAMALVGTLSLLAGLLVLFNSPGTPEFARISLGGALGIAIATGAFFLFIVAKVAGAQRRPAMTGKEGLLGQTGRVRKTFVPTPEGSLVFTGSVLVQGELWRAQAESALQTGEEVVVTGAEGFTLHVARLAGATISPADEEQPRPA